jgi:hypothetical protein
VTQAGLAGVRTKVVMLRGCRLPRISKVACPSEFVYYLRTVKPTAHAHRFEVLRIPNPTVRFAMIPTTPVGMFSKAAGRLLNPISWIKVVEYVPVSPEDIEA